MHAVFRNVHSSHVVSAWSQVEIEQC